MATELSDWFLCNSRKHKKATKYGVLYRNELIANSVLQASLTISYVRLKLISLCRWQSNPLVYTVYVFKCTISCFKSRWVARIYIVASDWSKPLFDKTQGKNKPIRSDYIYPHNSVEFETRYRALIRRRLKPLFDTNKLAAAQAKACGIIVNYPHAIKTGWGLLSGMTVKIPWYNVQNNPPKGLSIRSKKFLLRFSGGGFYSGGLIHHIHQGPVVHKEWILLYQADKSKYPIKTINWVRNRKRDQCSS